MQRVALGFLGAGGVAAAEEEEAIAVAVGVGLIEVREEEDGVGDEGTPWFRNAGAEDEGFEGKFEEDVEQNLRREIIQHRRKIPIPIPISIEEKIEGKWLQFREVGEEGEREKE